MFRKMRRYKQELSLQESQAVLMRGTSGVLAVLGDDDYPYAVPLSYLYDGSRIIFHMAKIGHKMDAIEKHSKVSFCVIDQDQIVEEKYTTYFRSVIVFGKAHILSEEIEKREAFENFAAKYSPRDEKGRKAEIQKLFQQTMIVVIEIEHMSGKEAIELKNNERRVMMSERRAHLYCGIVAVIWGLGFIAVERALVSFSCFEILFIRFMGSAILAWLLIIKKLNHIDKRTIQTSSQMTFQWGDLLALGCAVFFAAHLVSLQYTCVLEDSRMINAIQLGTCALLSLPCLCLFSKGPSHITTQSILACVYIVVFATFLCFFLQTKAQQVASASSCSVILSTESLFAVIFSAIILHEYIKMNIIVGGLFILISVILVQTSSLKIVSHRLLKRVKAYR